MTALPDHVAAWFIIDEAWTERVGGTGYEDRAVPWLADFEQSLDTKGGEASRTQAEPAEPQPLFDTGGRADG